MSRRAALTNKDASRVMAPDNKLRRKIGVNVLLDDIFTPERIKECQEMLDTVHEGFLREMQQEIIVLGDEYMHAADHAEQQAALLEKSVERAFNIKSRMESLGFSFGFEVAKSLYRFLCDTPLCNEENITVVCKHVAVLNLIVKEGITDDGGHLGREMLADLQKLIKKVGS